MVMRVLGRQEVWIHTHFFTDAKALDLKQRQKIKWEMEGFLRSLGIVFGIHFQEGERVRVVLECLPEERNLEAIHSKLQEVIKDMGPKPKVVRIKVEGEDEGRDREAGPVDS